MCTWSEVHSVFSKIIVKIGPNLGAQNLKKPSFYQLVKLFLQFYNLVPNAESWDSGKWSSNTNTNSMYVFMKFAARFVWKIGVKTQKKHFENQKFQHLFRYVFRQLEAHKKKHLGINLQSISHILKKSRVKYSIFRWSYSILKIIRQCNFGLFS